MSLNHLVKNELRKEEEFATRRKHEHPPDLISLAAGDPNFLLPTYIADTVANAIEEGCTHYCWGGDPAFKEAIAEFYAQYGYTPHPEEQITITTGASHGIFQAYATILNPGDEVITFDPSYHGGRGPVDYFGATLVQSPMKKDAKGHFRVNIEALKDNISENTKALYFSNPGNPTGIVYQKSELQAIADLAKDHDFIVVTDELYTEFIWGDNEHIPLISLPEMENRTIVVMALTKIFAWAGMRTGWIISGPELTKYIKEVPNGITGVAWPIQKGATTALKDPKNFVAHQKQEYQKRLDYCRNRINEMPNITCSGPEGGIYLFPDISATELTSEEFCDRLYEEEHLRIVPGSGYGPSIGEGHVRLAMIKPLSTQTLPSWFKNSNENSLEEAMERLERFTVRIAN